jgi:hypothetical protein
MNIGYVYGGQQFDGIHGDIDVWLRSENRGVWLEDRGCSTINGSQFYNHVAIPNDDDFVVFLLKFAGKVCKSK